ncbi:MAG TPA: universal stress protein, partial [Flavobacteriales bacterium]|nr:universal stress protein [Flavobacteriales bacterium]
HVLLADDGGALVPGAFGLMLELARRHSAEVTVVHVEDPNTLSTSVGPDPIYHAMLGDLPHTFLTVEDEQVAVAIDHEAVANKVDLVTVLHRHLGPLESLFHKSTAEQLALHAHVPLLVLQQ